MTNVMSEEKREPVASRGSQSVKHRFGIKGKIRQVGF